MNEAETRAEHIDPALKAAGWGVVEGSRILREYHITPGRIEGRGRRGTPEIADYVLVYRNIKLAQLLAHIRRATHREFLRDPFLRDCRPFPKQLREGQLLRSGSFHAWQVLGAESRCRQSVFHTGYHAPSRGKKRREIQGGGCVASRQSRIEDKCVKICTLTPFGPNVQRGFGFRDFLPPAMQLLSNL